jgi:IS5 family transposase
MRPRKIVPTNELDLYRAHLKQIINPKHELVRLAAEIDWDWIDGQIAPLFAEQGRPAVATRFMVGLLLLKHIYGLSDEEVCERWVDNPYFQHFTGEEYFQHEFPHERSGLSHWRKRLGDKLDVLLAETLRVAHASGALRSRDLARVTVDTTVQPKNITFPTDAKLVHSAITGLNRLADRHSVPLRQSYLRLAKRAAMMAGRYAHAKQFNRYRRELRFLRTRLGRIVRDIARKVRGSDLEMVFYEPLQRARQIRSQEQRQRGFKIYSFHAPEVECIGKGKECALRVRREGLDRHHQPARAGRAVRAARHLATGQSLRRPYPGRRHRRHREAHRPADRARVRGQGIPWSRHRQPAPGLPLRPEARRGRRHQA